MQHQAGDLAGKFLNPLFGPYTLAITDGASHLQKAPVRTLYHSVELEEGGFTPDDLEPAKTDKTRWVQFKLNELGYYGGPVGHDFDDYLKKAVIRYKANHVKMHQVLHSNYTGAITADLETALAAGDNARRGSWQRISKANREVEGVRRGAHLRGNHWRLGVRQPQGTEGESALESSADSGAGQGAAARQARQEGGRAGGGWPGTRRLAVRGRTRRLETTADGQAGPTEPHPSVRGAGFEDEGGGRTATTGDNCHQDFAGVRATTNDYKTPFILGTAYEPYDVKDDAGQKVCFSVAVTDDVKFPRRFGPAGGYFRTSYVAGDSYQLRADLDFSGRPNQKELEKLHGVTSRSKRISGRTGTFEVTRRGSVAFQLTWPPRKNDPEWAKLEGTCPTASPPRPSSPVPTSSST